MLDLPPQEGIKAWRTDLPPLRHKKDIFFLAASETLTLLGPSLDQGLIPARPWRDRDFILEVFMNKFTVLNPLREGYKVLRSKLFETPPLAPEGFSRPFFEAEYLYHSRLVASFPSQEAPLLSLLFPKALFGLYLWGFENWLQDESDGFENTLVFLDRTLQKAEQVLERKFG